MKKTIILAALMTLAANTAFAAALATNVVSTAAASVYGGVVGAAATAPTPLIKFSTGVRGIVNFPSNASYLIRTKHDSGNKIFGTNNALTNIYWHQSTGVALTNAMVSITTTDSSNFVGNGWTSY